LEYGFHQRKFLFYDRRVMPMETMRKAQSRTGISRTALLAGLAVALAWLGLLTAVHGLAVLAILGLGFAALGLAGWLWGADSRDGSSWSRREPGTWR
jgi:hypothetical protein